MSKRFLGFTLSSLRFALSLLGTLFLALCSSVEAQQAGKIPRIAYVSSTGASDSSAPLQAFRQGLRDLGYVEGKNILVEYRYLEGKRDRIQSVVAELVQLKVDVIVPENPPVIRAAKRATQTIPIVIITSQDPVAAGYVESLARPGVEISQGSPD
jgi:putative tryptophan/tyrosine transport system substrate-binding protein